MSIGCTYDWNGKKYSKDRILRAILQSKEGSQLSIQNPEDSIKWLKDKLGMDDSQIRIVAGLITGKSLGRFLQDGRILLSTYADSSVVYHEAFHRVWRMSLTPNERKQAVEAFKKRKGWQELIDSYKESYPANTEQELIEEYLADEFSDFSLNPDSFKIEQPIKSFFERLMEFITKMLGLKQSDIRQLYYDIHKGKYKNIVAESDQYRRSPYADKIKVGGIDLSVEAKSLMIREATRQLIEDIIKASPLYLQDIIKGKDHADPRNLFFVKGGVASKLFQKFASPAVLASGNFDKLSPEAKAIFNDTQNYKTTKESFIYNEVQKQFELIGIKFKEEVGNTEDLEKMDSMDESKNDVKGDNGFNSQLEVDPKTNMSKQIRILLGSFYDETRKNMYGFNEPISWSKAFISIAESMAGVPSENFMEELLKKDLPFKNQLKKMLYEYGAEQDPTMLMNFRNDFKANLSRTVNAFNIMQIKDGEIFFFDANENTRSKKVLKDWQNQFVKAISEKGEIDYDGFRTALSSALKSGTWLSFLRNTVGITINPDIEQEVSQPLYDALLEIDRNAPKKQKTAFSNANKPDITKLFKELDIEGNMNKAAEIQARYEDAVDLMVFAMGKKIYGLGLNNQVSIMINRVNFAISQFTPEMDQKERMQLLIKYVPHLGSAFFISEDFFTKEEISKKDIRSKWLEQLLEGNKLKLNIIYNGKNDAGQEEETADMDETDLLAMHLNGALQGMNMSMKHSDRSIFYAYSFEGSNLPLYNAFPQNTTTDPIKVLNHLTNYLADQIKTEIDAAREYNKLNLGYQYYDKASRTKPGLGELIGEKRFAELMKSGGSLTESDYDTIQEEVDKQYEQYRDELFKWGLIEDTGKINTPGINKELFNKYGKDIDLAISTAYVNEIISHVEEAKFISGDLRFFKTPTDLFKRLAATSSTGTILANDDEINDWIDKDVDANSFDIVNPRTGETTKGVKYAIAPRGMMRGITLKENETYESHLLKPAVSKSGEVIKSKLTGNQESEIFMVYEYNFLNDPILKNLSQESLIKKIRNYESKYRTANENDGQTWMNIFAFKYYMNRLGKWNKGMEMVFQTEKKLLAATTMKEIADITIEINGKTIKPFEIPVGESFDSRVLTEGKKPIGMDAFHTLKTQFSGFSVNEAYSQQVEQVRFFAMSIFKTSNHILMPSAIIGTNLQTMNHTMLTNGIDVIHMGSANKVGGVDPQQSAQKNVNKFPNRKHLSKVAEKGLEFYDESGHFNNEVIDENKDLFTYLFDVNYYKDQVNIGNKVKESIKGSTQSLKLMLSNLLLKDGERFEGAKDLVNQYKKLVSDIVGKKAQDLLYQLNFNGETESFEDNRLQLQKVLLDSQQAKGAPENVINALYNFISNPIFESLPNKTKIENILYAIPTNRVISFNRSGNSYPQTTSTGYETIGSRKFNVEGNPVSNQDTVKFYSFEFDNDGTITKVNPAEVIIPLPKNWIEPVLKMMGTRNLVVALQQLNDMLAEGKLDTELTFKGLRIPNQQLSSNDIFKVKKFNLPTAQSYAIVPTELVTKTGSD